MALNSIILNTYLIALFVVGVFSLEAAYLVFKFIRHKKTYHSDDLNLYPAVTVQLPIFNEYYVAERLIRKVCALDYPTDKLEIQVLDDSTDNTRNITMDLVKEYSKKGLDIVWYHRENRSGFKAGALKAGLEKSKGEFVAIFDADFMPDTDFLKKTVPYFKNNKVGMVQTRWTHLNENYSLLTKVQAFGLAGHFIIEQNGRNRSGLYINFNGTAGIWRKTCIIDAGNWQDDTLTEDLDLSYRAQMKGWKFLFVPDIATPAELPAEVNALKNQQYRWTKGSVETALKILPELWKSALPFKLKIHSSFHLTNNFVYPFILILSVLNLPLIMIKHSVPNTNMYFFIFAFFLVSFAISFLFYAISQKSLYPDWIKRMFIFPVFMSGSMGLSINNSRAVFSAILRHKSPFIRTPKYHITADSQKIQNKQYKSGLTNIVFWEISMALYSFISVIIALYYLEFGIIPFMLMFLFGFGTIGYLSLKHYFSNLQG